MRLIDITHQQHFITYLTDSNTTKNTGIAPIPIQILELLQSYYVATYVQTEGSKYRESYIHSFTHFHGFG